MTGKIQKMTLPELLSLKAQVELALIEGLFQANRDAAKSTANLVTKPNGNGVAAKRTSPQKGQKVPPKYRDPKTGITWSGRGRRPAWVKQRHLIAQAA